jgi:hypothetical protein
MKELGCKGKFAVSDGGNVAIVGNPNFAWIEGFGKMHPKLVVWTSCNVGDIDFADLICVYLGGIQDRVGG